MRERGPPGTRTLNLRISRDEIEDGHSGGGTAYRVHPRPSRANRVAVLLCCTRLGVHGPNDAGCCEYVRRERNTKDQS